LNYKIQQIKNAIILFKQQEEFAVLENDVIEQVNNIAYLTKTAEYQTEKELRLVVTGIGFNKEISPNKDKVFINLVPITSIVTFITLGPKVEQAEEVAAVFYYTLDNHRPKPNIFISRKPFK